MFEIFIKLRQLPLVSGLNELCPISAGSAGSGGGGGGGGALLLLESGHAHDAVVVAVW